MHPDKPATPPHFEGTVLPLRAHTTPAGTVSLVVRFEGTPYAVGPATAFDDQGKACAIEIVNTHIPVWDLADPVAKSIWLPEQGITVEMFITGVTADEANMLRTIRQTPSWPWLPDAPATDA